MLMKTSGRRTKYDPPAGATSRSGACRISRVAGSRHARPEGRAYWTTMRAALPRASLLDLDLRADVRELLLDRGGFVLRDAFLDRLGRPFDEVLRFLEAQAGDLADDLDHVDLVAADFRQDRGELGLLLGRRRAARGRTRSG